MPPDITTLPARRSLQHRPALPSRFKSLFNASGYYYTSSTEELTAPDIYATPVGRSLQHRILTPQASHHRWMMDFRTRNKQQVFYYIMETFVFTQPNLYMYDNMIYITIFCSRPVGMSKMNEYWHWLLLNQSIKTKSKYSTKHIG